MLGESETLRASRKDVAVGMRRARELHVFSSERDFASLLFHQGHTREVRVQAQVLARFARRV